MVEVDPSALQPIYERPIAQIEMRRTATSFIKSMRALCLQNDTTQPRGLGSVCQSQLGITGWFRIGFKGRTGAELAVEQCSR